MNGGQDPAPFDVCGPLPTGVTVLEASAGTGKTFAIAALAARYVADGTPLEHLLVVTFTRMATGELRERVRERLVSAEEGLRQAMGGVAPADDDDDEILQLLARGRPDELALRHRRLGRALTDFDAATIATTHGFCEQVLSGLGVAGDVERGIIFVEDLSDLLEEVVDDLYIARFHPLSSPPFSRAEALRIAKKAVENPFAPLEPRTAGDEAEPGIRRMFAGAVRAELELRKRRGGIMTFDDHLAQLRNTLADEVGGAAACARLRARYRVALVDEFQDTDPIQWEIMRRAFGEGGATLVLIGDPKQAIYAFRGADVYAYLDAGRHATTKATLDTNWRSDKGLLDAFDAIFRGANLGHEDIPYRHVQAAKAHYGARLVGAPVSTALRLRVVYRDSGLVGLTPQGYVQAEPGRLHVAADLSADVVRLLSSSAKIITRRPDGSPASAERVRPGHIAVLVRTNKNAVLVRDALNAAGVPAVINGAGSVFATPTAREWLRLLEALERPTSPTHATSASLTCFLGWNAEQVASADEVALENLHTRLHRWAGLLRQRGVASLLEAITRSEGLFARMLARLEGERQLTDLRHIGQLLHVVNTSQQLGTTALTAWLRQRIADSARDTETEERNRRLESDAEAVQVLTIHRSKGLEFPIVYYPYLWEAGWIDLKDPPIFHDPEAENRRTIDVGGAKGPDYDRHWKHFVGEQRGEELRLAYVALTRAKHQAVVWWAGSYDSQNSALSRLLFSRDDVGNVGTQGRGVPGDAQVSSHFRALAVEAPGCISVERSTGGSGEVRPATPRPLVALEAGRFDRRLDSTWRRNSYSGITWAAHEAWVTSEPEQVVVSDETETGAPPGPALDPLEADEVRLRSISASLANMPAGMDVGTFVHSVLETTDFAIADLKAELTRRVGAEQARHRLDIGDQAAVVAGLQAAIETPLGPLMGEARLRDIGLTDRVDEMTFELPLVGGDTPNAHLTVPAIASLLREHLPADHVLAGYSERLEDPALRGDLRGYLTGSLDLVLRTRNHKGTQRFAVVDYKTNWLGAAGRPLSAWHYRPAVLVQEMQGAHYPLQALLYTTALHRYLRWRLRDYDPECNLAGVLYLFVRGMTGAGAPRVGGQPCGVFAWKPPTALVEGLSDLLYRGTART